MYGLTFTAAIFYHKGTDRPTLELLNRYVVVKVAPMWYELGMELLGSQWLYNIRYENPHFSRMGCKELFKHWLYKEIDASWNKLIAALERIQYYALAEEIRRIILKGLVH